MGGGAEPISKNFKSNLIKFRRSHDKINNKKDLKWSQIGKKKQKKHEGGNEIFAYVILSVGGPV